MKRLLGTIAGLAMLGLSSTANAEDASGKIATVDQSVIVLEDGTALAVGEGVSVEGLEPGMEVMVSFEDQGGQLVATGIQPK